MTETETETQTLLAAYDDQMRGAPPVPAAGVTYEKDGPLLRIVGETRGFVTGPRDLGVQGRALDELIVRQRDFFAARGEGVEWKIRGHDEPADLTERLRAAGFVPEDQETVLIGRTEELTAKEPALPDGVTVRRVTEAADLHRIAAMESAIWRIDLTWLATELLGRITATPNELAVYVAEADGEVISASWLVFYGDSDFAGLRGGSTVTEWRGKGVYRALVATRAALAAARGVPYLQVDASNDSAPILRRLGFRAVTTTTPYVWSPDRADQAAVRPE